MRDVESLREHYARTLRRWVANLEGQWDRAVELAGAGRARVWRLYMTASALSFDAGVGVAQVLAVRRHGDGASGFPAPAPRGSGSRDLLAVGHIGHDRPGIIADVTAGLADLGINLEDSSMTLLRGHFAMTLVCAGDLSLGEVERALALAADGSLLVTVRSVPAEAVSLASGTPTCSPCTAATDRASCRRSPGSWPTPEGTSST